MSRWFRHYAGMMRDAKLVRVAVRVKQPVERVVWVWGAILESAAEIDDAGRYELDAPEVAYFLRTDEVDIRAIADGLADAGHVAADRVVKWGDRQYQSDTSKERQARYRERQRGQNPVSDGQRKESDVTPPSRDGKVTPQETDTEAEIDITSLRSVRSPAKPTPRHQLEEVLSPEIASAVIEHRQRLRKPLTERAAKNLAVSLAKFPDPNAAADRMIEKGWLSIDPDWAGASARGSPPPKASSSSALSDSAERLVQSMRSADEIRSGSRGPSIPALIPHLSVR